MIFFAANFIDNIHFIGNCEQLTLPVFFFIPKLFFNFSRFFQVKLLNDFNLDISKKRCRTQRLFIKISRGTITALLCFNFTFVYPKIGYKNLQNLRIFIFHLSQVIKYMTFLPLNEKSLFIKYILPVTFDVNFISDTRLNSFCKCNKNCMV